MEVVASCENLLVAVNAIKLHQPDVVFLDIEMPQYAGYEIVRFFDKIHFEIIFTTAYEQYAIKAFEVSAIDYLLKPIDINRLKLAVNRVKEVESRKQTAEKLAVLSNTLEERLLRKIVINDKGQQHIIDINNIIAIEASESYCIVHTTDAQRLVSKYLKHFETLLEELPLFLRVHKSWLVNTKHVVKYTKSTHSILLSNGLIAKLSKYKKAAFEASISS